MEFLRLPDLCCGVTLVISLPDFCMGPAFWELVLVARSFWDIQALRTTDYTSTRTMVAVAYSTPPTGRCRGRRRDCGSSMLLVAVLGVMELL